MHPATLETRLKNISNSLTVTTHTLELLVVSLKLSGLEAISNTTQSLAQLALTIKQNKEDCAELMEHTSQLLTAIIDVYLKSDNGEDLAPSVLNQIAKLTVTLRKIQTFVEVQQGSRVKNFFRQGELGSLLKDCKAELQHELAFFSITTVNIVANMEADAQTKHQEVLDLIEVLSSSDSASSISNMYSGSFTSSASISMLPAKPKIFYGREPELTNILKLFNRGNPRIAILGAGGMGKTSLAKAVLHEEELMARYTQYRFFVPCDGAGSKLELAALIGAHLGLKPGRDMTQAVLQHLSVGKTPASLQRHGLAWDHGTASEWFQAMAEALRTSCKPFKATLPVPSTPMATRAMNLKQSPDEI